MGNRNKILPTSYIHEEMLNEKKLDAFQNPFLNKQGVKLFIPTKNL